MIREMQIPLFDLVICLSDALDLISLAVVNHHKQVAYIAYMISRELGLPVGEQKKILIASLLHDRSIFSQGKDKHAEV